MQYRKPKARPFRHASAIKWRADGGHIPVYIGWVVTGSGIECVGKELDDTLRNHRACVLYNQTDRSGMRIMSADE